MRSSNWPARPTNGRPIRSSSPPGASPTSMIRAPGAPSAKTSWVAVAFRPQPSKRSSAARSASSVSAPAAISRAERAASSGAATAAGARLSGARGAGSSAAANAAAARRRHAARRRRGAFGEAVVRRLVEREIDARLAPPAQNFGGGGGGQGARFFRRIHGKETSWPRLAASSMSRRPGRRGSTFAARSAQLGRN